MPSSPQNEEPDTPRGLFRRRSTQSPDKEDLASPKSHEDIVQSDDHHSAATAEDDSGSEDLEVGVGGGEVQGKCGGPKCCGGCSKKALLCTLAWMLLLIGLAVGLTFAFYDKQTATVSSSSKSPTSNAPENTIETTIDDNENEKPVVVGKNEEEDDKGNSSNTGNNSVTPGTKPPKSTAFPKPTEEPLINEMDPDDFFNSTNVLGEEENNTSSNNATNSTTKVPTQVTTKPEMLEWPEFVGMPAEQAKQQLEEEFGKETYDIIIVPENSPVTKDLRFNRIRLFVNEAGIITRIPRTG
jgi:Potato inhibitor I family